MNRSPRAWCWLRNEPHYRYDAFAQGLRRAGYKVESGPPLQALRAKPGELAGDVLLTWNRYWDRHDISTAFEKAGGTVLVAENGYLGMDRNDRRVYALARHAHNGRGEWFPGGPERLAALLARAGITLSPMDFNRQGYVLVAPNRPFGMPDGVMPKDWAERTAAELRRAGNEVRIRPHPGNGVSATPLEADIAGAAVVHIWSSSVGVESLARGIPVVCHAPWWICKGWEEMGRDAALARMAWGQWTTEEIQSGECFRHLLRPEREAQVAAGA